MRGLGRRLAAMLRPGDLVVLTGPLGAGKTTLVQGIGDGLGVRGPITSPTFVIARVHPKLDGPGPALVHADAYRLGSRAEVDDLDLDTDLESSVTVVEWGEGLVEDLAESHLEIRITMEPAAQPRAAANGSSAAEAGGSSAAEAGGPSGAEAGGPSGAEAGGPSGAEVPDEARTAALAATGERWEAAAESLRLALIGATDVL